jgi:hypothetical protein
MNVYVRHGNHSIHFQGLYEVAQKLKGSLYKRDDGLNLLKILVPLPLRGIYQMIPLPAKQILLDGPFKGIVQRKLRWVESCVNWWLMLQYWGAGH